MVISPEMMGILYSEYDIEFIAHGYEGVENQLYVEAMDTHFVVRPIEGEPDWDLLIMKLERYKRGYHRDIRRVDFESLSTSARMILRVWRFLDSLSRRLS